MLLIAVSFQEGTTCSCVAKGVNASSAKDCLDFICKKQLLPYESVDEVLVVEGDRVVYHYTPENWKVSPTMSPIPGMYRW